MIFFFFPSLSRVAQCHLLSWAQLTPSTLCQGCAYVFTVLSSRTCGKAHWAPRKPRCPTPNPPPCLTALSCPGVSRTRILAICSPSNLSSDLPSLWGTMAGELAPRSLAPSREELQADSPSEAWGLRFSILLPGLRPCPWGPMPAQCAWPPRWGPNSPETLPRSSLSACKQVLADVPHGPSCSLKVGPCERLVPQVAPFLTQT